MGGEELRNQEGSFLEEEDEEEVELPGFRFHPTDEELVGFYLRRQLDKKPIKIELIKQIDIYKYDPWDLPKAGCTGGEKEWYFFCKRGRKYRNSIRPNRVTGSGFWKATGIDKPVTGQGGECIGLKKTLVYYRGSAGKGTKTDWMMHEFRLPSLYDSAGPTNAATAATNATIAQQAEIWTLCRIFKRNAPPRKHITDWRSSSSHTKRQYSLVDKNASSTVEIDRTSNYYSNNKEAYINFGGSHNHNHHGQHYYSQLNHHHEQKPAIFNTISDERNNNNNNNNNQFMIMNSSQAATQQQPQFITASSSNLWINNPSAAGAAAAGNDFFTYENWDELGSVVKFALDSSIM